MKASGLPGHVIEAFRGLRANSLVNVLAVGTIAMAMLIVGVFALLFINIHSALTAMGDRLEMSVYLTDTLSPQDREFLVTRLKAEPGVTAVVLFTKAEALEALKRELAGQERLIEGLGENPLPDSYELKLSRQYADAERMERLSRKIASYHGVEDVSYGRQGVEVLGRLLTLLTTGGLVLAALLGVSVVFIISNSVRLALYSRGQEIELMQWIGATRWFIQAPFLVEGIVLAVTGAALAIGILAAAYAALPPEAALVIAGPKGLDFLPPSVVAYMIAGSGALGLAGAFVSVNKFLE